MALHNGSATPPASSTPAAPITEIATLSPSSDHGSSSLTPTASLGVAAEPQSPPGDESGDLDAGIKTAVPTTPELKPIDKDVPPPANATLDTPAIAPLDSVDVEAGSSDSHSSCHRSDKVRGFRDVGAALAMTWHNQKWNLFTSWVHVPIGITSILFLCWAIKNGIDQAPFRFPAPVICMALLFFGLLLLDWLSLKFPGKQHQDADPEKVEETPKEDHRRRFLEPVMKLVAPPCDFCLRNMSVMFTPSFILIPARELIPRKEIGLLTMWFIISQVAAFVFPVLLYRAYSWIEKQPKNIKTKIQDERQRRENLRRIQSRRSSNATLAGGTLAKQMSASSGGRRLSAIASGLNDLTAVVTAPISHITLNRSKPRYEDERLQLTHVQIETARQQGDPAVSTPAEIASITGSPQASYDGFFQHRHPHRHHHHHHHHSHNAQHPGGLQRGRSMTRATEVGRPGSSSRPRGQRPTTPKRSRSVPAIVTRAPTPTDAPEPSSPKSGTKELGVRFLPHAPRLGRRQATAPPGELIADQLASFSFDSAHSPAHRKLSVVFDEDAIVEESRRPSKADSQLTMQNPRGSCSEGEDEKAKASLEVRTTDGDSITEIQQALPAASAGRVQGDTDRADDDEGDDAPSGDVTRRNSVDSDGSSECEGDAVERLSEWIADLISPLVYLILFIVGIPLFFLLDFALPLFLGINLLTFLAAINVVPPKWRRYLHPILTTSVATVLIIWAFGEMKGLSLSGALDYYSNGAKYSVLWDINGYRGPVPGAGDLLFSTLDAGIVALAVPMYRYRRDLAENFTRMMLILTPCAALSLFFWPWIARLFGLDAIRALAFSARFMSTPLAIEMANNVGADESITVIMVVVTGIVAAVLKEPFFKLMRISMDDHICVGVTMGSTAGAIGASSLISRPRVMAVASLSFVLFGTLLLICAAIPAIVDVVRDLAGAVGPVII